MDRHPAGSAPGQSEDALGDDVALNLRRAAGDRVGEADEEAQRPAALLLATLVVDDRAVRALDLHAELVELFAELRARHLHVRVLGRGRALGEAREPLVPEGSEARRLLIALGDPAPHDRILRDASPVREVDEAGDRLL